MLKKSFKTHNPTNNMFIDEYVYHSEAEVSSRLDKLFQGYLVWKKWELKKRLQIIDQMKSHFIKAIPQLVNLMALEMGKPVIDGNAEVRKVVQLFDYYLENSERLIRTQELSAHYKKSEIHFDALGVILSFMPWNYPVWQVFRFAIPAWVVGNTTLLKHSELTPQVADLIVKIVEASSAEIRIMDSFYLPPQQLDFLYQRKEIRGVTFTGSTLVGSLVAGKAALGLKKTVLELGGNDAYIVHESADIQLASSLCAQAKLVNNGQSCVAAKRFFVSKKIKDNFLQEFKTSMSEKKIGDPLMLNTQLGPLASEGFKKKLESQLEALSKVSDEVIECSQKVPTDGQFMVPKIILFEERFKKNESSFQNDLQKEFQKEFQKVFQEEEVFGPLALVYIYDTEEEMLARVNDTPYGLGLAWFGDENYFRAKKYEKEFDVGMIAVNNMIKSDPRTPFGGVKNSGYGRELGTFGIYEFCNIQCVGWG